MKFPHNKINTSTELDRMPMEVEAGEGPRWLLGTTLAPVGHMRKCSLAAGSKE